MKFVLHLPVTLTLPKWHWVNVMTHPRHRQCSKSKRFQYFSLKRYEPDTNFELFLPVTLTFSKWLLFKVMTHPQAMCNVCAIILYKKYMDWACILQSNGRTKWFLNTPPPKKKNPKNFVCGRYDDQIEHYCHTFLFVELENDRFEMRYNNCSLHFYFRFACVFSNCILRRKMKKNIFMVDYVHVP